MAYDHQQSLWSQKPGETKMVTGTNSTLYQSLCQICQTDEEIKDLFNVVRSMVTAIPCQRHPKNLRRRYQINNSTPFRLRCCFADCYHKLQRTAIIQWLATLVLDDVLDGEKLLREMRVDV